MSFPWSAGALAVLSATAIAAGCREEERPPVLISYEGSGGAGGTSDSDSSPTNGKGTPSFYGCEAPKPSGFCVLNRYEDGREEEVALAMTPLVDRTKSAITFVFNFTVVAGVPSSNTLDPGTYSTDPDCADGCDANRVYLRNTLPCAGGTFTLKEIDSDGMGGAAADSALNLKVVNMPCSASTDPSTVYPKEVTIDINYQVPE